MGYLDLRHRSLCALCAVALLAGCGSPQPPLSTNSPAMPNATAGAGNAGKLLYVANGDIFTLPQGKPDGRFVTGHSYRNVFIRGMCTDSKGHVFVSADDTMFFPRIDEYEHGGTRPVAELRSNGWDFGPCSVDPTTGNLAVIEEPVSLPTELGVYAGGRGKAQLYSDRHLYFSSCAYDDRGNLFAAGYLSDYNTGLAELPAGSSKLVAISLPKHARRLKVSRIQWDGTYLAMTERFRDTGHDEALIFRLAIDGDHAKVAGIVRLESAPHSPGPTWISGNIIVASDAGSRHRIGVWHYPAGGSPFTVINGIERFNPGGGETISESGPSR